MIDELGEAMAKSRHQPKSRRKWRPNKPVVLIGLMGAGKSSVGRRLAQRLGLPFVDSDSAVEEAAGVSVAEIFERLGEPAFRDGERRVIQRLLDGEVKVIATGGGAFMDPATRALIHEQAIAIWLKVELDVLVSRVGRRDTRPLLRGNDPHTVLHQLAEQRYPVYGQADIIIAAGNGPHDQAVDAIIAALKAWRNKQDEHEPSA